jgi:hypothetical protein
MSDIVTVEFTGAHPDVSKYLNLLIDVMPSEYLGELPAMINMGVTGLEIRRYIMGTATYLLRKNGVVVAEGITPHGLYTLLNAMEQLKVRDDKTDLQLFYENGDDGYEGLVNLLTSTGLCTVEQMMQWVTEVNGWLRLWVSKHIYPPAPQELHTEAYDKRMTKVRRELLHIFQSDGKVPSDAYFYLQTGGVAFQPFENYLRLSGDWLHQCITKKDYNRYGVDLAQLYMISEEGARGFIEPAFAHIDKEESLSMDGKDAAKTAVLRVAEYLKQLNN